MEKVGARTGDLKEKAQSAARGIAERTQRLEEAVVSNLQGPLTAREVEAKLEADARRLSKPAQAADVLERWLQLIRSGPQTRYPDTPLAAAATEGGSSPGARSPQGSRTEYLSFQQVFLRSRALEYAIDTAARTPELRAALRERALPPPEVWPEERPPPVLFAQAFVALLRATVGPPEVWLALFSAMLSAEKELADEPCHVWLVQLLAGLRGGVEEVAVRDREREVLTIEDVARQQLATAEPLPEVAASPGSLAALLAALAERGDASGTAFRAFGLRKALSADLERAAIRQQALAQNRIGSAAAVSAVAAERASALEADSARQRNSFEGLRAELEKQVTESRAELDVLQPAGSELQREIEQSEMTQRELLRQVGQLAEKLDTLRKRKEEHGRQEEKVRGALQRADTLLVSKLEAEDDMLHRGEGARALAATVCDLANELAASRGEDSVDEDSAQVAQGDPHVQRLLADATKSRDSSATAAVKLAEHEALRLSMVLRVVDMCAEVVDERERSRAAMEDLGVPSTTLESDVVGEAEIAHALHGSLVEVDRYRTEVEALCRALEENAGGDPGSSHSASADIGSEESSRQSQALVDTLRGRLAECVGRRARLIALAPLLGVPEPPPLGEGPEDFVDPFLLGSHGVSNGLTMAETAGAAGGNNVGVRGAASGLLARLAVRSGPSTSGGAQQPQDPSVVDSTEAMMEPAAASSISDPRSVTTPAPGAPAPAQAAAQSAPPPPPPELTVSETTAVENPTPPLQSASGSTPAEAQAAKKAVETPAAPDVSSSGSSLQVLAPTLETQAEDDVAATLTVLASVSNSQVTDAAVSEVPAAAPAEAPRAEAVAVESEAAETPVEATPPPASEAAEEVGAGAIASEPSGEDVHAL